MKDGVLMIIHIYAKVSKGDVFAVAQGSTKQSFINL